MRRYIRVIDGISHLLGIVAMLLLIAGVLVVTQMVVVRYVLRGSTIWQTDFVTYAVIAATFLGSPYVLRMKGHVSVDLLPNALSPGPRLVLGTISGLLTILFCALLAWSGWQYFEEALQGGWTTESVWKLPLWIPLLPLPVGIGLLCLQAIAELLRLTETGR